MKLGDDDAALEALRASGLRVTNCVPQVPSILPNTVIDGPADVEERVASMRASLHRLAPTRPTASSASPARPAAATRRRRAASSSTACGGSPQRPTMQGSGSAWSRSTPPSATS